MKDILIRAGLVYADPEDVTNQAPEPDAALEAAEPAVTAPVHTAQTSPPAEGLAFDTLYTMSNLPAAPFPAERLLKLLDGLRAMDAATRRAAVLAMDEADETWTLDEVIADAARKSTVLKSHVEQLRANLTAGRDEVLTKKSALVSEYEGLRTSINEQITQLQQALELAATEHTQALATLDENARAAEESVRREQSRLGAEVTRLESIANQLSPAPSA